METMYWFNVNGTVYRIVQYCFCAVALYVLCTLARHVIRQHCMQCRALCDKNGIPSLAFYSSESASKQSKDRSTNKSWSRKSSRLRPRSYSNKDNVRYASQAMIGLSLSACLFTINHILLDLWVFADKRRALPKTLCIRQAISGILYFLCALCVYLFLWIRQRVFYAHPVLRHLAGPRLNRFSWSVLVTIIFCFLTFIVIYTIPNFFELEEFDTNHLSTNSSNTTTEKTGLSQNVTVEQTRNHSCTFKRKNRFLSIHFAVTLVFLYFQISLQILFVYPVLCNQYKRNNSKQSKDIAISPKENDVLEMKTNIRNGPETTASQNLIHPSISRSDKASVTTTAKNELTNKSDFMLIAKPQNVELLSRMRKTCSDSALRSGTQEHKASYLRPEDYCESVDTTRMVRCSSNDCVSTEIQAKNFTPSKTHTSKLHLKSTSSFSSFRNSFVGVSSSKKKVNTKDRLRRYIWRCFAMSFVCCLSDLLAFGFSVYTQITAQHLYNKDDHFNNKVILNLPDENMRENAVTISLLSSLAYNGNMVVNLLCLVLCYDDWPGMLFPCCKKTPQKEKS